MSRESYGITRLRHHLAAAESEARRVKHELQAALDRQQHDRTMRQIVQDARRAAMSVSRGRSTAEDAFARYAAAWRDRMAPETVRHYWEAAMRAEERLSVEIRDRELIRLYRSGMRNREIAARLKMTETYAAQRLYTLRRRSLIAPSSWVPPAPYIAGPDLADIDPERLPY